MTASGGGPVREPAPAKINLWLHVRGRRADGYHLIDSLVAFADFGEAVTARPAADWSLAVEGPEAAALGAAPGGAGEDNLVLRAARAFARVFGGRPQALTLEKCLPVASGIGGGSADAAATLRLLARREGVGADDPRLGEIALGLGADVPMCLASKAARVGGIGELVTPVAGLGDLFAVAVNPRAPVSTAEVFRRLGAPDAREEGTAPARGAPPAEGWIAAIAAAGNDLEPVATALVPAIAEARAALAAAPGCLLARMSGSGATVFGLFAREEAARAAAAVVAAARGQWWVRSARLG